MRRPEVKARRWLELVWGFVVAILSVTMFSGGDLSIVSWLLHLVLTAPFGMIFWFYLYEPTLNWIPSAVADSVGVVVVDVVAFVFWFVLVPRLPAWVSRRT